MADLLTNKMLRVCIDSNVYVSAIAFKGKPLKVLDLALERKFSLISSTFILNEVNRNLVSKIGLPESYVQSFLNDIIKVSNMYEPMGLVQHIPHKKDTLILEIAMLGNVDVLVTGDKKDLLCLKSFHGIEIESPLHFLERLSLLDA